MGDDKKSERLPIPASARIDWDDLKIFLAVAENGSISAAAKALNLGKPTVSDRMSNLELQMNTQLFARGPSGAALTEAGALLREQSLPMLRASQNIDRSLREIDQRPEGRVKIAGPEGVLTFWLAPRVPAFQRTNPSIMLSIDAGFWPEDPVRRELDISLQYDEKGFSEHVVEPLATVHYGAFATQKYLEMYGTPRSEAELATHRMILHSALKQQQETWDPKAEAARTLSRLDVETNCSAIITLAVLGHGGITYIPTFTASYFEGLVMLGDRPVASPVLYLVYDPRIARVARAARVLDWLKEIFSAESNPWFQVDFVHPREFSMHPSAGLLKFEAPAAT